MLFTNWLLEEGKTLTTARNYATVLRAYLKEHEFDEVEVRRFILEKQLTKSASCRNKYVKAFKLYGRWQKIEWVETLKKLAEHADSYDLLTPEELWNLIELRPYTDKYSILFLVLASTGARPSEILKIHHHNVQGNFIKIKSKTQEIRKIALHSFVAQTLAEYSMDKEGLLFPSPRGGSLTTTAVVNEFKKRLDELGITKNTRVYDIRHAYVTRQVRNNPLPHVQKQVGHSSLKTTQFYTHPDENDLLQLTKRDTMFQKNKTKKQRFIETIEQLEKLGIFSDDYYWEKSNSHILIKLID